MKHGQSRCGIASIAKWLAKEVIAANSGCDGITLAIAGRYAILSERGSVESAPPW
jgi:hypothetical protein